MSALRCQRIGCDATFTKADNPEGSCRYHDSGPIFHDGSKEWSCCKQRSHDFSLFLAIPGCMTGKHTLEKPVTQASSRPQRSSPLITTTNRQTSETCSRCKQGFYCSEHGTQAIPSKPAVVAVTNKEQTESSPRPVQKRVGFDVPQTCQNKGCGKVFKEKDNHDSACEYHPGPAVFHDRSKGWKCCDLHVKEFDEFINIPPCTKGWHNADGN